MNIAEIEAQLAELVLEPLNPAEFPLRLLEIYNAPKATLTKLRSGTQNKGEQPGDLLWARKIFFRPAASGEAQATVDALKDAKATPKHKPRFLISTDGVEVVAYDVKADDSLPCDFAKLNDRFDFFLPLAGIEKYEAVAENPADIKAAGRLAKLHDEIERCNPDWLLPEKRHALNQFLTRVLFCMFAEDTGSFPADLFVKTVSEFGGADGENLQGLFQQIFNVMNVPDGQRDGVPAHLRPFPYVNGGLFAERTEVPVFNRRAKRLLVEAAQLDWKEINPDIFGSMIQAVVDPEMRGDLGMHYTSVPNIMKVLQPLFLISLEEEFERSRGHREERSLLRKLLTRISKIRVFDPACGSGNFLIIAYRELRTLEMRVFQRLDEVSGGTTTWREQTGVKLSNFFGIELADFAAETAKLSLWIAEYQMNQRFKSLFGEAPKSFPLREGGHIVCGNALRTDWLEVCPPALKTIQKEKMFDLSRVEKVHATEAVPDDDVETYIVGNPPYLGSSMQTASQKADVEFVFSPATDRYKNLDYVSGWFFKACEYLSAVKAEAALVATNSVCQGDMVSLLWPLLFARNAEIGFAHQSFPWKNNANNNAAVICIVVGLRQVSSRPKRLYSSGLMKAARNINPYLIDFENIVVQKQSMNRPGFAGGSNS
ncbi:DNA methyltransferase [Hyphomicrobium sp.]|uniref:DNA methyltransferase n=1 Tax=Hyphomicrobium sp. TaxID=82 RepID=UPI002FDF1B7B